MPTFTFTSPEGKTYDIEGPEGATKEQAFGILQQQLNPRRPSQADTRVGSDAPGAAPQSLPGFVGGNIAKGIVQTVGPYAEKAREAVNLPGDIANRILDTVMGKKAPAVPKAAPTPVGPEELTAAATKAGAIGPSAEPRTTGQRYGAAALQALPSAAMPGAGLGVAGRVVPAVGAGLGGQLGQDIGGETGAFLGSLAGGMAGGAGVGAMRRQGATVPAPPSEAARASRASGIPLTLGQETGSAPLRFFENSLKDWFASAGTGEKDTMRQITAGGQAVERLASQISSRATASPEDIGNQLRTAYKNTVTKLDTLRDTQAGKDYGAVRAIAGDKPVISYKNTLDTLDKIIAENKNVPAADARKIVAQAQSIRDALTETAPAAAPSAILGPTGKPVTPAAPPTTGAATHAIDDAIKTRSAWGKAARRTGNIFSDIDPNANQVLAKRLFGAINRDFDAAGTGAGSISQAMKVANDNFRKASQSLTYLEKSALGRLIGEDVVDAIGTGATASTKAPEAVAQKYLTMKPSEARTVTNILQQHAPEVLQDAKAFVLRNGLEQARNNVPGQVPISFAKFRADMKKVEPKLKEMGFTPKEIADIKDVTDTMERVGDKLGLNLSKTAGVSQAAATLGTIGANLLIHPGVALGAAVGGVLTPYVMSKALLTPQGRELLRTVATSADQAKRGAAIGALRAMAPATANLAQGPAMSAGGAGSPAEQLGISAPPAQ